MSQKSGVMSYLNKGHFYPISLRCQSGSMAEPQTSTTVRVSSALAHRHIEISIHLSIYLPPLFITRFTVICRCCLGESASQSDNLTICQYQSLRHPSKQDGLPALLYIKMKHKDLCYDCFFPKYKPSWLKLRDTAHHKHNIDIGMRILSEISVDRLTVATARLGIFSRKPHFIHTSIISSP